MILLNHITILCRTRKSAVPSRRPLPPPQNKQSKSHPAPVVAALKDDDVIKDAPRDKNVVKDALKDGEVVKDALRDSNVVKDALRDNNVVKDALKGDDVVKDAPKTTTTSNRVTMCSDCFVCVLSKPLTS